jgi:hypothetical protein
MIQELLECLPTRRVGASQLGQKRTRRIVPQESFDTEMNAPPRGSEKHVLLMPRLGGERIVAERIDIECARAAVRALVAQFDLARRARVENVN